MIPLVEAIAKKACSIPGSSEVAFKRTTRGTVAPAVIAVLCSLTEFLPLKETNAQSLPSGFAEFEVATFPGVAPLPTCMAFAPDGRIFVSYKYGELRIVKNGTLLSSPFVSVNVSRSNERGLLGIAFDPAFASNRYIYLYYTVAGEPIHNRISRFTADSTNPDTVVPGSELVLMELDNVSTSYHNAGDIHFGLDGKLYVNVGNDTVGSHSASLGNRFGKILRINPDGSIPTDNPFYNDPAVVEPNKAIWAYGLRNPFKSAIQPGTGRIFILDVGEATWEEINDGVPGANYGWPAHEGPSNAPGYTSPLLAYGHGDDTSTGRAITGGAFYNPPANPSSPFPTSYLGKFFYGDYVNGWIRYFDPAASGSTLFASDMAPNLVDMKVGLDGSVYYLTILGSSSTSPALYKIQYTGLRSPQIGTQPRNRSVAQGQAATFAIRVSGDKPMSFQWKKNGVDVPGATDAIYTTPPTTTGDNGATFRCTASNAFGSQESNAATLSVAENTAPTTTITGPASGALFNAGDNIFFSGSATDAEDGTLPATAFAWQVDFHHHEHSHPGFLPETTGIRNGTFTTTTTGETSPDIWYRIYLTVTDTLGTSNTTYTEIFPRKSTVTLASNPPGLRLTLDGEPQTGPTSTLGVVGMQRPLSALSPQILNGKTYQFESWSDGGAGSHTLTWPSANTTYTALFRDSATVTNGSQFITQSVPTAMTAGRNIPVTVTMKNTGTSTWPAGSEYGLGSFNPPDNATWGFNRVRLNAPVPPGGTVEIPFNVTPPAAPGVYNFQWKMVQDGLQWFGEPSENVPVTVSASPNDAAFVSHSIPTSMVGGQYYRVSVTMKNTGTSTWAAGGGFALGTENPRDNLNWGPNRITVNTSVSPGTSIKFNFDVIAPSTIPGLYNLQWRMVDEATGSFGALTENVTVNVSQAANAATFVTQVVPPYMAAGQGYDVRITMKNTGTNTWPGAYDYRLGSQNPRDNFTWGLNRANLPTSVLPDNSLMIPFNVVAPTTPGEYNFQWRMLR